MPDSLDLDLNANCLFQPPVRPESPKRLSPITEANTPLTHRTPPPGSTGSLIPVLVTKQHYQQPVESPRSTSHGRNRPSSPLPALSVKTQGIPPDSIPVRTSSRAPPAPLALKAARLSPPGWLGTQPGTGTASPSPRAIVAKGAAPPGSCSTPPRRRFSAPKHRQVHTSAASEIAPWLSGPQYGSILGGDFVPEPQPLRPRAQSALAQHDVPNRNSHVLKAPDTPRPSSAFASRGILSKQVTWPSRPLSDQLNRRNSFLSLISRSETPTSRRGYSTDRAPSRTRARDHIERQPSPSLDVPYGVHTTAPTADLARVDDEHEVPRSSSPIVRRPSVRIASFLHRIGQDAARRLTKSPTPSPLSMTLLPDVEGDLVGCSPVRAAIRCSGTFGVPDDESDTHSFHPFPDTHYRRRTSTGSLEERPLRRSLYLRNAHEADKTSSDDEKLDKATPINRQDSTSESQQSSPPALSRSTSQSTPQTTPQSLESSLGSMISPCSTFPRPPAAVRHDDLLLQASRLLQDHGATLMSHAESLAAMSAALRASATESLALGERLLIAAEAKTELVPPATSLHLSRVSTETPKVQQTEMFSAHLVDAFKAELDRLASGSTADDSGPSPLPNETASSLGLSGAGPLQSRIFTEAELLSTQGWAKLHAAERLWQEGMRDRLSLLHSNGHGSSTGHDMGYEAGPSASGCEPSSSGHHCSPAVPALHGVQTEVRNDTNYGQAACDSVSEESLRTRDTRSSWKTARQLPPLELPEPKPTTISPSASFDQMVEAGLKLMPVELADNTEEWHLVKPSCAEAEVGCHDKPPRSYRRKPPPSIQPETSSKHSSRSSSSAPLPKSVSSIVISSPSPHPQSANPEFDQIFMCPRSAPPIPTVLSSSSSTAIANGPLSSPPSSYTPNNRLSYIKVSGNGHGGILNGGANLLSAPTTGRTASASRPPSCEPLPRQSLMRRISLRRKSQQPEEPESKGWFRRVAQ